MAWRLGPPTDLKKARACGSVVYAVAAPNTKSEKEAATKGTAYLRSLDSRPGEMKRQNWKRMTGEAITRPPNTASLIRRLKPSRGDVTKRLQVVPDLAIKDPADPARSASTLQSGLMRKCRIGS